MIKIPEFPRLETAEELNAELDRRQPDRNIGMKAIHNAVIQNEIEKEKARRQAIQMEAVDRQMARLARAIVETAEAQKTQQARSFHRQQATAFDASPGIAPGSLARHGIGQSNLRPMIAESLPMIQDIPGVQNPVRYADYARQQNALAMERVQRDALYAQQRYYEEMARQERIRRNVEYQQRRKIDPQPQMMMGTLAGKVTRADLISEELFKDPRAGRDLGEKLKTGERIDERELQQMLHNAELIEFQNLITADEYRELTVGIKAEVAKNWMLNDGRPLENGHWEYRGQPVDNIEDAQLLAYADVKHVEDRGVRLTPSQLKKAALDIAKGAYQIWIGDDIDTLLDPNANLLEKTWSGISLASNFIPGAAVGKLGLKAGGKALKIKIKFEKVMAKQFPNVFWRGHYANMAEKLSGKGAQAGRAEFTKAGYALSKHGNRKDDIFPKLRGNNDAVNQTAQEIVENILFDKKSQKIWVKNTNPNRDKGVDHFIDVFSDSGQGPGIRYSVDKNGEIEFWGFRNPQIK